jgi:hypothetical protein
MFESFITNLGQLTFLYIIYLLCRAAKLTQDDMRKSNDTSLVSADEFNNPADISVNEELKEELLDRS